MPEGDTIHRVAAVLRAALAGATVTRFEPRTAELAQAAAEHPLAGRTIEAVEARGKHLLVRFSGGVVLRTHLRMHGAWHLYRPGERWQRSPATVRFVLATAAWEAVGFAVPEAELVTDAALARGRVAALGPDLLADDFDGAEALRRLAARPERTLADALLDQRIAAGVGNVYKSEILFLAGLDPHRTVGSVDEAGLRQVMRLAREALVRNAPQRRGDAARAGGVRRRTRASFDPTATLWVYRRTGEPCRRCGTPVRRDTAGARATFWCPRCQR